MKKLPVINQRITTIKKLFAFLDELKCNESLIYRGCTNSHYKQTPGFFRFGSKNNLDEEYAQKYRTQNRIIEYIKHEWDEDESNLLFFYCAHQHYGGVTRLLDFSHNPLVALLFAVEEWDISNKNDNEDGIIYIIDSSKFEKIEMEDYLLVSETLLDTKDFAEKITIGDKSININSIYFIDLLKDFGDGVHSERIINQSSCFLFFPSNDLNNTFLHEDEYECVITIDHSLKQTIVEELKNRGITMEIMKTDAKTLEEALK